MLFLVPRGPEGELFIRDRLYQIDLAPLKKKTNLGVFCVFVFFFFNNSR